MFNKYLIIGSAAALPLPPAANILTRAKAAERHLLHFYLIPSLPFSSFLSLFLSPFLLSFLPPSPPSFDVVFLYRRLLSCGDKVGPRPSPASPPPTGSLPISSAPPSGQQTLPSPCLQQSPRAVSNWPGWGSHHCSRINIMFTDRSGLGLLPTCKDWRVVSVSLEPHGLRTVEGNLGDFLKENQEAIPEGGLADPRQRKTADVC